MLPRLAACVQRLWMQVGRCVTTCASMRAVVVDASLVPACVQRLWMRVGVCIITCASMRAAVADAPALAQLMLMCKDSKLQTKM